MYRLSLCLPNCFNSGKFRIFSNLMSEMNLLEFHVRVLPIHRSHSILTNYSPNNLFLYQKVSVEAAGWHGESMMQCRHNDDTIKYTVFWSCIARELNRVNKGFKLQCIRCGQSSNWRLSFSYIITHVMPSGHIIGGKSLGTHLCRGRGCSPIPGSVYPQKTLSHTGSCRLRHSPAGNRRHTRTNTRSRTGTSTDSWVGVRFPDRRESRRRELERNEARDTE